MRPTPRALATFALLLAAALAGCAKPPAGDGPTPGAPAFRVLDLGPGGPEPVIVVTPEGLVAVAAQDARGGGPIVWISKDGKPPFAMKRPTTEGGGEVDLAAGPGGSLYLTQLGTRGNVISVSHDAGETWRTAPLGGQTQYFDREWLAVDARGSAYAIARQFGALAAGGTATGASRSDDGGDTWVPVGSPWGPTSAEPGVANGNLLASEATLSLAYLCRGGEAVCLSRSEDRGATWRATLVADPGVDAGNVYPTVATARGRVLVAWADASSGRIAAYVSTSPDGKGSWTAPVAVSPPTLSATMAWVAARDDVAWVVFLGTDVTGLTDADSDAAQGARWFPYAQRIEAATGGPRGEPIRLSDVPVHIGVLSKPVGQGGASSRDRNFGDFFTAALDHRGGLWVAVSLDEGNPASTRDLLFFQE